MGIGRQDVHANKLEKNTIIDLSDIFLDVNLPAFKCHPDRNSRAT